MSVIAKFELSKTERNHWKDYHSGSLIESITVVLVPVSADGIPEHCRFAKDIPSGELRMTIDNPEAIEYFKPGERYYLTFESEEHYGPGRAD